MKAGLDSSLQSTSGLSSPTSPATCWHFMGLSHEPEEREVQEGDDTGRGKSRGWGEDNVHLNLCSDSWVFSGMQASKSVNFRGWVP